MKPNTFHPVAMPLFPYSWENLDFLIFIAIHMFRTLLQTKQDSSNFSILHDSALAIVDTDLRIWFAVGRLFSYRVLWRSVNSSPKLLQVYIERTHIQHTSPFNFLKDESNLKWHLKLCFLSLRKCAENPLQTSDELLYVLSTTGM